MGQITLRGVYKSYGAAEVIKGIDLDIRDGEFLVFVGPSGCGKSTTLRMIAGLEDISAGELMIDGVRANDVRPAERGAAMVFQSYALYPHMTVAQNMGFALKMAGVGRAQREQQVQRTAKTLRISDLLERYPKDLSGGQRQRVAIGRAIVRKPKVFLLDEPLSNLDAALRVNMRVELGRLHKELGRTMIYVTHDQIEAMTLGDRIAVFNNGKIEQVGTPMELYQKPANEFVASFLGTPKINLIEKPTSDAPSAHRDLWHSLSKNLVDQTQRVGIRPEHLKLVTEDQGVAATVMLVEQLGDASILHLEVDGVSSMLHSKVNNDQAPIRVGEKVSVLPDADRTLAFDESGVSLGKVSSAQS